MQPRSEIKVVIEVILKYIIGINIGMLIEINHYQVLSKVLKRASNILFTIFRKCELNMNILYIKKPTLLYLSGAINALHLLQAKIKIQYPNAFCENHW